MPILTKRINPNLEILVNAASNGVSFTLRATGTDPLRPDQPVTVPGVPPEVVRILLDHEWESIVATKAGERS